MLSDKGLIRVFRWVAIAEAASYLLLLLAMVFKYGVDQEIGVTVMGPIHGVLFLFYVGLALLVWPKVKWSFGQFLLAILLSAVPLGTIYVERKIVPDSSELAARA